MSTASTRSIEVVAKANNDGHRWYQLYWYVTHHTSSYFTRASRPRTNEVTLSILRRAKAAGFTALVVTLDTFALGWRPHDLDAAYLPFIAGVGAQVGTSDPVFMQRMGEDGGGGLPLRPDERPAFPLDLDAFRVRLAAGDQQARDASKLGIAWLREANSGAFRSWTDLAFLRENWDGPIVLKGIQAVQDAHAAMDAHVDGIIVSNHGTSPFRGGVPLCYNI
jgi:isopentenyl diphosphate isomerase/L-lactate dehydrogenase-like FMN-dependent dehydrogenase